MKGLLLVAVVLVQGCATCREHPIACTVSVATVLVVSGYEASHQSDNRVAPGHASAMPVSCVGGSCN